MIVVVDMCCSRTYWFSLKNEIFHLHQGMSSPACHFGPGPKSRGLLPHPEFFCDKVKVLLDTLTSYHQVETKANKRRSS